MGNGKERKERIGKGRNGQGGRKGWERGGENNSGAKKLSTRERAPTRESLD